MNDYEKGWTDATIYAIEVFRQLVEQFNRKEELERAFEVFRKRVRH
jgi:hypothetical protein